MAIIGILVADHLFLSGGQPRRWSISTTMFSIMDTAAETVGRPKTFADRACDQCKSRKVKCDMTRPCIVCSSKGFDCTYDKARKKRGPVGKRIEEIRRAQSRSIDQETTARQNGVMTFLPNSSAKPDDFLEFHRVRQGTSTRSGSVSYARPS